MIGRSLSRSNMNYLELHFIVLRDSGKLEWKQTILDGLKYQPNFKSYSGIMRSGKYRGVLEL